VTPLSLGVKHLVKWQNYCSKYHNSS
jgi:hypothetical protein